MKFLIKNLRNLVCLLVYMLCYIMTTKLNKKEATSLSLSARSKSALNQIK